MSRISQEIRAHCIPSIIGGVFGLVIGLTVPAFNSELSDNRFFLEKQADTAEQVADNFSTYVENWRRIIIFRGYLDNKEGPTTVADEKKLWDYAVARNVARDDLFSAFDKLHLYFDQQAAREVERFKAWDGALSRKKYVDLPPIEMWHEKQSEVLRVMRKDIMQ